MNASAVKDLHEDLKMLSKFHETLGECNLKEF